MSFQYIHTSAKRGLEAGKSGFCCVARDGDTPPDLAQELERLSRYHPGPPAVPPRVMRHRIAHMRSGDYHVLSRIRECGTDYSKRNNHIAHHLAFTEAETLRLPNPASILLYWRGWRDGWDEPPQVLGAGESFSLEEMDTSHRKSASDVPFPSVTSREGVTTRTFILSIGQEASLIEHLESSLTQLPAADRWNYSFTNWLLPTDQPQDYVWRGVHDPKSLPYELDLKPKPLRKRQDEELPRGAAVARSQAVNETAASVSIESETQTFKQPPVIEIPEAFDRKRRRRPRRKFGDREFSRSVNLAIALAAVVCLSLTGLLYRSHQTSKQQAAESGTSRSDDSRLASHQRQWLEFKGAGYPRSKLQTVEPSAAALRQAGDAEPQAILAFLKAATAPSDDGSTLLKVPKPLLRLDDERAQLLIDTEGYRVLESGALLPSSVAEGLERLATEHAASDAYLTHFDSNHYSVTKADEAIDALVDEIDAALPTLSPSKREALQAFLSEREATFANPQFAPYLALHTTLQLPDSAAYLAFDEQGLLASDTPAAFSAYLAQLFTRYFRDQGETAANATAFQAAICLVDSEDFAAAEEAARAIRQALELLEATEPNQWQRLRESWEALFARDDLMEQAILAYTLEALEASKRRLMNLSSQFDAQELRLYQTRRHLESLARELKKLSRSVDQDEEWVVISR